MAIVNRYDGAMPTPDKTSIDAIVAAARDLLEAEGLTGLTMQTVAKRVGVRAPSLYKRVANRDDLIRLVAEATLTDLAERLDAASSLVGLANEFRKFGLKQPAAFQLVMTPGSGVPVARTEFAAAASAPVLRFAGALADQDKTLEAARTLTAWVTGFVSMELHRGFNLGGDVEDAWNYGIAAITRAITARTEAAPTEPAAPGRQ